MFNDARGSGIDDGDEKVENKQVENKHQDEQMRKRRREIISVPKLISPVFHRLLRHVFSHTGEYFYNDLSYCSGYFYFFTHVGR